VATAFTLVITAVGAVRSILFMAAIPAAVLTGLAFSAPVMAYAATLTSGGNFNWVFRFVITPLFLFSGVFFPTDRLPPVLRTVATLTPLYHGVALTRGFALQTLTLASAATHVAYLAALVAAGTTAAVWTFTRKLRA
jgi:lipooligosaccharide transport system permease protein